MDQEQEMVAGRHQEAVRNKAAWHALSLTVDLIW
jgi:hypothetical protein